jgi:hypothetical protein
MKWRLLHAQISISSTIWRSSETVGAPLKRLGVRHQSIHQAVSHRRFRRFLESGLTVNQLSNAMWGFALRISFEFLPLTNLMLGTRGGLGGFPNQ